MNWIKRQWYLFLARLRLSEWAVCEMSKGLGPIDYHDYPDGVADQPWHFHTHTCRRCGKDFTI